MGKTHRMHKSHVSLTDVEDSDGCATLYNTTAFFVVFCLKKNMNRNEHMTNSLKWKWTASHPLAHLSGIIVGAMIRKAVFGTWLLLTAWLLAKAKQLQEFHLNPDTLGSVL